MSPSYSPSRSFSHSLSSSPVSHHQPAHRRHTQRGREQLFGTYSAPQTQSHSRSYSSRSCWENTEPVEREREREEREESERDRERGYQTLSSLLSESTSHPSWSRWEHNEPVEREREREEREERERKWDSDEYLEKERARDEREEREAAYESLRDNSINIISTATATSSVTSTGLEERKKEKESERQTENAQQDAVDTELNEMAQTALHRAINGESLILLTGENDGTTESSIVALIATALRDRGRRVEVLSPSTSPSPSHSHSYLTRLSPTPTSPSSTSRFTLILHNFPASDSAAIESAMAYMGENQVIIVFNGATQWPDLVPKPDEFTSTHNHQSSVEKHVWEQRFQEQQWVNLCRSHGREARTGSGSSVSRAVPKSDKKSKGGRVKVSITTSSPSLPTKNEHRTPLSKERERRDTKVTWCGTERERDEVNESKLEEFKRERENKVEIVEISSNISKTNLSPYHSKMFDRLFGSSRPLKEKITLAVGVPVVVTMSIKSEKVEEGERGVLVSFPSVIDDPDAVIEMKRFSDNQVIKVPRCGYDASKYSPHGHIRLLQFPLSLGWAMVKKMKKSGNGEKRRKKQGEKKK